MGLLSLLFGNKKESAADTAQKNQKKFEIFKYDGMRAWRMGHLDYAIKCFNEAWALENDFETMGYLAQTYQQTNQLEAARGLYNLMHEMEPEHIITLINLANVCYMQEDYPAMEKAAKKVIDIEQGNAMAHYLLGKAVDGQGNEIMSIAHLTKAITLKEDFIEARLMRAEALLNMRQLNEAMEDIDAILSYEPENEQAILLRGQKYLAEGNSANAEEDYRHIIALNPFNEQAFLYLGELYIEQGKLNEAIATFDEAIELNPQFAKAYHERGRAKLLNGDKEGSLEDVKKAMEFAPKEAETFNGTYHNFEADQTNVLGL